MITDKWRTQGVDDVKPALEITSHLSGALDQSQRRAEAHQLLAALRELRWCEIASLRQLIEVHVNHTPRPQRSPWTGEDKSEPPSPHLLSSLRTAAAAALHGRLSSGSLLVKCNRPPKQGERGDYHGLFVVWDWGRWMWVEKEDDWLLSKGICLKNNSGCLYQTPI